MKKIFVKIIDSIDLIIARCTHILMCLSGVECLFEEVRNKRYQSEVQSMPIPQSDNFCEDTLNFIKEKNKEVNDRRDKIDTKARTLLTLTSLLLGLISSLASPKTIGIVSVLPLVFLFFTIFLLIQYFGIETFQTTDYSCILSDSTLDKRTLAEDIIQSSNYNQSVTDFFVDLYRSALRYFFLATLLIMVLGIWNIIH